MDVAVGGVVVVAVLIHVDDAPHVASRCVSQPAVRLAASQATPAINELEAEVGYVEAGVAVWGDQARIHPSKVRRSLSGCHSQFEYHVGTEQEDGVSQNALTFVNRKHDLGAGVVNNLTVESRDEVDNGREVQRAEIITLRSISESMCRAKDSK
jgi:hypothetical protein